MGLNALKSDVVEYTGGVNVNTTDGTNVTVDSTRGVVTSTSNWAGAIDNTAIVAGKAAQFGEQVFNGDLKLNSVNDSFGAPARQ